MNKVWKIVLTVALAALVLGVVCIGVSLITDADLGRISNAFGKLYDVEQLNTYIQQINDSVDSYKALLDTK